MLWGAYFECVHCPADKFALPWECEKMQKSGKCTAIAGYEARRQKMELLLRSRDLPALSRVEGRAHESIADQQKEADGG